MKTVKALLVYASLTPSVLGATIPQRRAFGAPTENGFPNPNDQQIMAIAEQAGGKLPGGALPTGLNAASITTFQLIAFNELFETAYFSSLLNNLTTGVAGYTTDNQDAVIEVVKAVRAQEEFHALGAITILKENNAFAPSSCEYAAPVANLKDAIFLAETFTAVVLGALQGASVNFAKDPNGVGAVGLIASVIGQEGEQNGAYRLYLERIPSESPFLTAVPAPFAWSALQLFVVPGSCPYALSEIALPIFPPLAVNGGPIALVKPEDQTLSFSADLSTSASAKSYVGGNGSGLYATFVTGQQLPYSVPISNAQWSGSTITFEACFAYTELVAHGFSHVSLTTSCNISSVDAIPDYTLAAPAVIQVDNSVFAASY